MLLLSLAFALSTTVLPAEAQPDADPDQVEAAAAAYLADVHADGTLWGGSLSDLIFALAGADEQAGVVAEARATLGEELAAAVEGGSTNPGIIGKGLLGILAAGGDARDVDGVDVEAALRDLIVTDGGADDGRIGASSNFIQALGVMALAATADGAPRQPPPPGWRPTAALRAGGSSRAAAPRTVAAVWTPPHWSCRRAGRRRSDRRA